MYCKFSHKTVKDKDTTKEINDLKERNKLLMEKIKEKENEIQIKDAEIKSMKENFE